MTHAEARRQASFYANPRTGQGQVLQTFSQGLRVSREALVAALETELSDAFGTQAAAELEELLDYAWAA